MLARLGRLNTRLAVVIGSILIVFLSIDIWHSARSSRDTAIHEVERWSVLLAETVRVSLNVLMKEDKMDARFGMYEAMAKEIPGLEKVRVIRGEKVNALFQADRERKAIPREQEAIADFRKSIEELNAKLKTTRDAYERRDIESEIAEAQKEIANSEKNIRELQSPIKSDKHELPSTQIDRQVLDSGKPHFIVEGDKLQVWSPYIAQKSCGATGGCHIGVKDGDVLGAVNMEFSLVAVNREISSNIVFSTVGKIVLSVLIIGCLLFVVARIILRQIGGEPDYASDVLRQVAGGDLTVQVQVRPG
ncbi:MAG: hypothetical protein OEV23_08105, partial [Gallionella sp.]|nr:hypothetical protein [Gallionella sp.]